MAETTYSYNIPDGFPGVPGSVNIAKLDTEIKSSNIVIGLERIDVGVISEDTVSIVFKDEISASDFQALDGRTEDSVLDIQSNATLDPGATPAVGDRYIITNSLNMHANFGTISGLEDNDIVEYSGTVFVVDFDSNQSGNNNALVKNENDYKMYSWGGSAWAIAKAGGLIIDHDNTPESSTLSVIVENEIATKKSSSAQNVYIFSPDVTDRTTWYHDGVQVTGETVGVGDGAETVFQLQHGNGSVTGECIVDLAHGRVTDETNVATPAGVVGGFLTIIKFNGAAQTEREAYMDSGGVWQMDYNEGEITFFDPPPTGTTITADYWYVPTNAMGCLFRLTAPEGTYTNVDYVEAQFSIDMDMQDSIIYTFTPVSFPSINLINPLEYKNMWNIVDFNVSALPVINAQAGVASGANIGNNRNLTTDMHVLPWRYTSELQITGDLIDIPGLGLQKIQLLAYLKHGKEFVGTRGTVTIYGTNRPNGT